MSYTRRWQQRTEHGIAVVWLALTVTVLMIVSAFVVDLGNARQQKANGQAFVDASALSGVQTVDTSQTSQAVAVFNFTAATLFRSLSVPETTLATLAPTTTCAANQGTGTPAAVCQDYKQTVRGVTYDVQITTPYVGPGETAPDQTQLHVLACWDNPNTFAQVIKSKSLHLCAAGTAQNGAAGSGTGGQGGCGAGTNHFADTDIKDTLTNSVGSQTITATYHGPYPVDLTRVHFVVQNEYGDFVAIPPSGMTTSVAGKSYGMTPTTGGKDLAFTYALPSVIDASARSAAYSTTFSANLQVIDTAGRNCGSASWTTCNQNGHDPVFDGGAQNDGNAWGVNGTQAVSDDQSDQDGHDLNSTVADADDTVTPAIGTLVKAGTPVGAIYNDEWPLRAASVALVVDGASVAYDAGFAANRYSFIDPSTVGTSSTTIITGLPGFASVDPKVSTVTRKNGKIQVLLEDGMGNPIAGETVSLAGTNQTSAQNGTATFTWPANNTYTVSYAIGPVGSPATPQSGGNGSMTISVNNNSVTVTGPLPRNAVSQSSNWPHAFNTRGVGNDMSQWGNSTGVLYNSSALIDGWHSALLWANDGDVTASGGDCGLVSWVFSSTGGTPNPGSIHLID